MSRITHERTIEINPNNFMKVVDDGTKIYEDKNLEIRLDKYNNASKIKIINSTSEEDVNTFLCSLTRFVNCNVNHMLTTRAFMWALTNAILNCEDKTVVWTTLNNHTKSILKNEFNENPLHRLFKTLVLNSRMSDTYLKVERNLFRGFFMLLDFKDDASDTVFDRIESIIIRREFSRLYRHTDELRQSSNLKEWKTGMDVTDESKNKHKRKLNKRLNKVISTLSDLEDTLLNQGDTYYDISCLHNLIDLCEGLKKDPDVDENELVTQCFLKNK